MPPPKTLYEFRRKENTYKIATTNVLASQFPDWPLILTLLLVLIAATIPTSSDVLQCQLLVPITECSNLSKVWSMSRVDISPYLHNTLGHTTHYTPLNAFLHRKIYP